MNTLACDCCGKRGRYLVGFYLYRVCDECATELKCIAKGEHSHSRNMLIFYINAQACFLHKGECAVPSFNLRLTDADLNACAQWMQKMSRIPLT